MTIPRPTPIYRLVHVDNLPVLLRRGGLHAPNHTPNDGQSYRTIHNVDIQNQRQVRTMRCGPGGTIHDYVAFYFGPRSPMLFQLHTGWVEGYREGEEPLIYLVSTVELVVQAGRRFVFSDGHGIAVFTQWFDDLRHLDKVDWGAAYATYWYDTVDDMDRQRRKQSEFLVYRRCGWGLIHEIGVVSETMKCGVERILAESPSTDSPPVKVRREWYYRAGEVKR